jgi:hypothetical protein
MRFGALTINYQLSAKLRREPAIGRCRSSFCLFFRLRLTAQMR